MSTNNGIPPSLKLHHTLRGHNDKIARIAWSPDGSILASTSNDQTIRLWNIKTGQLLRTIMAHSGVFSVTWSPNGQMLASGSSGNTIRLWDALTGQPLQTLIGHSNTIYSVAWSPDGRILASGSEDHTIRLWDVQTGQMRMTLREHSMPIYSVAWSPDGRILASGSEDHTIRLWDVQTGQMRTILSGHSMAIYSIAWSPDGQILASGSRDKTICLWEPNEGHLMKILEGHTEAITCVSFSYDGRLFASKSVDEAVFLWRVDSWIQVETLEESGSKNWSAGLAFHPTSPTLATLGEEGKMIRIWDLDVVSLLGAAPATSSVHYTTAKIALVGDSGVGKTGLGYRIAEDRFEVTKSTHGQQFWVVDKLGQTRSDGTKCEAVLWDFAGQPNFRPIHALFLDDVDLALLIFDPSRQDTFTGVDYWLKQLSHKRQLCHSLLVAARMDVSTLSSSSAELEAFCRERNISGGYLATSALTSEGVDTLLELIRQQVDWDAKPATITTETFKRIKDFVLALKVDAEHKNVLVSPAQLRTQLQATDPGWQFSDTEMMTAAVHLQKHGYVTLLRRSSNEQSILLVPDVLINLAASYMLKAQSNEKGLGTLEEARALRNDYHFPEVEHVSEDERDVLLNAVTELFLTRNVCFRESVDDQTFLIFPSLISERPPQLIEETEQVEKETYIVTGLIENIYATLVVLLGYSSSFQRTNQWRKQAQYETVRHEICGFKLVNDDPGVLELVLYYGKNTPDFVRSRFQGLFEEILYTRDINVTKYPTVFCPHGHLQERRTVIRRIKEGKTFLYCYEDGEQISLPKLPDRVLLSSKDRAVITYDQAFSKMRTIYETALVSVKGYARDRGDLFTTKCFVSYAWGDPIHEQKVLRMADDLRKADINVVIDQLNNAAIGSSISRFISLIEKSDFILVVGTLAYREKYENKVSKYGSVVAAEVDLINVRLMGTEEQKASILPLLFAGKKEKSFPPLLHGRLYADFTHEETYFSSLFDLVLTLHHIPFEDPIVRDLRTKLREEG